MSDINKTVPELDALHREAVAWFQRLTSGQATIDDAEALKRWRDQSAAHSAALADASRAWSDVGPAGLSLRRRDSERANGLAYWRRRTMSRRAVLGGGLATAAAASYAVIDPPLGLWPSLSEFKADYRTATGRQLSVTVADDVSVQLNTQTSIAVQPPDGERARLELIAGEASFATAPEARRSLVVRAGDGRTVTSDGRFSIRNIRASESWVCVTCFGGDVRIEHKAGATALGPGQQIRYDATGLGRIATVDQESASAWQRGIVVFRATPLAEVVVEINRYRPGRIVLLNAALGRKLVNGRFRIDQMDEILARLELAFGAKSHVLAGGIVLLS
ncbi:iron dicitrate transport regulator FecR [Rhodoblastus sphagnicola]|uniref:Iron dicitrate transport regulator FecR n=1 Tax=Rhodoblastus sphagnicola TaxID=333368 RepID=A0A2S6MWH8_9HYPH|nr:FecR domain-containing protein [Rhodoblastus sphagnicola]MBB4199987.1 transmembrane sensor [Rhodoblastus sphagnicola]PPQ26708.1 iron dicitrate transport regulator FecR [Rhodoblastus sphagnicola]